MPALSFPQFQRQNKINYVKRATSPQILPQNYHCQCSRFHIRRSLSQHKHALRTFPSFSRHHKTNFSFFRSIFTDTSPHFVVIIDQFRGHLFFPLIRQPVTIFLRLAESLLGFPFNHDDTISQVRPFILEVIILDYLTKSEIRVNPNIEKGQKSTKVGRGH